MYSPLKSDRGVDMRPKEFDFDPINVDPDGLVETITPVGAGAITLDGALTSGGAATLDYARRLNITSDGVDSGVTFTVTGTDQDLKTLVEVITGPSTATVESTGYFKTVSSIVISGAGTGNITIGTVDEISSQTIPIDYTSDTAAAISVDVSGTIDFTVQETYSNVQETLLASQSARWLDLTALADKTVDTNSTATKGAVALRLVVNSYSSGAEIQMNLVQPGR